ncbi:hypothetical protein HNQ59_001689 [Chitinivorax tropicus]|uniref:Uncharacterized protein n=1 Tax=Chitinivorax tropicus TaxID=714531 RepID=A0A840MT60_9PROT|nr:hypothetical protein [Chitinivorax tropicus]MBB5018401.1 hypothetical protein [Chitinivorax tropicus]
MYQLTIVGLQSGASLSTAKQRLVDLFELPPADIEQYLAYPSWKIAEQISLEQAQHYQAAMFEVGLISQILPLTTPSVSADSLCPEGNATPAAAEMAQAATTPPFDSISSSSMPTPPTRQHTQASVLDSSTQQDNWVAFQPDGIQLFGIDAAAAEQAARQYMVTGEYTVDDLVTQAVISSVDLIYVPLYLLSGEYEARWSASFGYTRSEEYTEWKKDPHSNGQKAVTRQREITDWHPASGTHRGHFRKYCYAGTMLTGEMMDLVTTSDADMTSYSGPLASQYQVEPCRLTPAQVAIDPSKFDLDTDISNSIRQYAQGDKQRDWRWTTSLLDNPDVYKYLAPVARVTFTYQNKAYRVWIDGHRGQKHVGDPLPEDSTRKSQDFRAMLPFLIALLGWFGTLYFWGWADSATWQILLGVLGGTLLAGLLRILSCENHSIATRQARLETLQAGASPDQTMTKLPKKSWFVRSADHDFWLLPIICVMALFLLIPTKPLPPSASTDTPSAPAPGMQGEGSEPAGANVPAASR